MGEPSWRNGRKQSSSIYSQLEENKTKTKQVVDFIFCLYFLFES